MKKKSVFFAIALMVIGLAVVPQIQAQDREAVMRLDAEMTQKRRQAETDYRAGSLTAVQFTQRLEQIYAEYQAAYDALMQQVPTMNEADLRRLEELYEQRAVNEARFYEGRITQDEYNRQREAILTELGQFRTRFQGHFSQNSDQIESKVKKRWPGNSPGWLKDEIVRERLRLTFRQPSGTRASHLNNQYCFGIYLTGSEQTIRQTFNDWKRQLEAAFGRMTPYSYSGGEGHENRNELRLHSRVLGTPCWITIQISRTEEGACLTLYQEWLGSDRGLQ